MSELERRARHLQECNDHDKLRGRIPWTPNLLPDFTLWVPSDGEKKQVSVGEASRDKPDGSQISH